MSSILESGVGATDDRAGYDALLTRVHQATFASAHPPAHPRPVIEQSWDRLRRRGLRPDRRAWAAPTDVTAVAHADTSTLLSLVPLVQNHLDFLVRDDVLLFALADAHARVVHTDSGSALRANADSLGFVDGAVWSETRVGTNAIGTALSTRQPVQVHGAEHYCFDQHSWSCAGAPIRDPRSGATLGVVNISVTSRTAHPATLGLAALLAHTASLELRESHRNDLHKLRSSSWANTRGVAGSWVVVDRWGWVAAANGAEPGNRLTLPDSLSEGAAWVSSLGMVSADAIAGGWLLRTSADADAPHDPPEHSSLTLRQTAAGARVRLVAGAVGIDVDITHRQADILTLLVDSPEGLTAPQLSTLIYGTPEHDVTVRAEISRLRRQLGGVILAGPYRVAPNLTVTVEPDAAVG